MYLRTLEPSDAALYRDLHREALVDSPESFGGDLEVERAMPLEQIALGLRAGPASFVLGAFAESDELVGIAGFGRGRDGDATGYGVLWGMYVARARRRDGIGRELLMRIVEIARGIEGVHAIRLRVVADNHPAVELYRAAGFRTLSIDADAFLLDGRSYDERWMELRLR